MSVSNGLYFLGIRMLLNLRIRVIFQGLLCLMVMNVLFPQALAAKADFELNPIAAITDDYFLEEHPAGVSGISPELNFGGYSPQDMKYITSELLVYDDTLIRAEDGENFVKLEGGEYIEVSESARLNGRTAPSPKDFPVRDAEKLQPVDLQAGESRQFWVTLHTLAGHYQAVIEVIQDGDVKSTIPVKVEVLPFTLADQYAIQKP
jgi:hypothetical protein